MKIRSVDHHGDFYDELRYNTESPVWKGTLLNRIYTVLEPFADGDGNLPAATAYESVKAIEQLVLNEIEHKRD